MAVLDIVSRVREGLPHPLGATWDGKGVNFALFSAHATRVELCLFDDAGERETAPDRIARIHRRDLAWLSAGRPARARSTATACMAPTSRTAGTASIPTSCCSTLMRAAHVGELKWDPAVFGYTDRNPATTLTFDERDSAPFMPKCVVVDPNFDWKRRAGAARVPWEHTILYETHVRGFTKLHPAGAGALRGTYKGLADEAGHRLHQVARRHLGRAAADPHLHQRQPAARKGPDELLGLQHDRIFRARSALRHEPEQTCANSRRWSRASRGRARGHSRRRLQPHRRGQRARPDAVVQGHRQRLLLPADARRAALLHQRHRHRKHAQSVAIRG